MKGILALPLTVALVLPLPAFSAVVTFDLDPFTGDPTDALVTVDDTGGLFFSVSVQVTPEAGTGNIGDITGIFFDASDAIALGDINVTTGGPAIGFENNTSNLGGGVNLNGGGPNNPGTFDVGLRFGGFNVDDVQLVEFTVANFGGDLGAFTRFALRLQTVGPVGGSRGGSSKLVGDTPVNVPEPTTLLLVGAGLLLLRRRVISTR